MLEAQLREACEQIALEALRKSWQIDRLKEWIRELRNEIGALRDELSRRRDEDRNTHLESEECRRCGKPWLRWVDGEYRCWGCDG